MRCRPPSLRGLILGLGLLALSLGGAALGLARIGAAPLSVWLVLWAVLPLVGVPVALVVAHRLFGLATAEYAVDRDSLRVRWGWALEEAPLAEVVLQPAPPELYPRLRPTGLWWPGCLVGKREIQEVGQVEFFATQPGAGLLLVSVGGRRLGISPPDPQRFLDEFVSATRLGSLRKISHRSVRPEFFSARVWEDRVARFLVLIGVALPLGLLGYLGAISPRLPGLVPFGFDLAGRPNPMVPPSRLLFLPLIGGLCWLADVVLGSVLYRLERDRRLAYGVWGLGILVGVLIWGATLYLMAAA
jgi:Bacterial PH domain